MWRAARRCRLAVPAAAAPRGRSSAGGRRKRWPGGAARDGWRADPWTSSARADASRGGPRGRVRAPGAWRVPPAPAPATARERKPFDLLIDGKLECGIGGAARQRAAARRCALAILSRRAEHYGYAPRR